MVIFDPVCGMTIDPEAEEINSKKDYQGKTYYFCGPECMEKFQENPDAYLSD